MTRGLPTTLALMADRLGRPPATLVDAIERGFAAGVAEKLSSGTFTYTDRAALLTAGRHLGLDPVRANLIVALQQSRTVPVRSSGPRFFAAIAQTVMVVAGLLAWGSTLGH